MKIETKFNVGDVVFYTKNQDVYSEEIILITIKIDKYKTEEFTISYQLGHHETYNFGENVIFHTEREAYESLDIIKSYLALTNV